MRIANSSPVEGSVKYLTLRLLILKWPLIFVTSKGNARKVANEIIDKFKEK
jgi:hypothetical protein